MVLGWAFSAAAVAACERAGLPALIRRRKREWGESSTPGGSGGAGTGFQLVEGTRCHHHQSGGHTFILNMGVLPTSGSMVNAPSSIDDGGQTLPIVMEGSERHRGSEGGRGWGKGELRGSDTGMSL